MLEDLLLPNEVIVFSQEFSGLEVGNQIFDNLAITNNRIIFYKRTGLIFRKDHVATIGLSKITGMQFKEKGVISKKGVVTLHLKEENDMELVAGLSTMKYLYQSLASKIQ